MLADPFLERGQRHSKIQECGNPLMLKGHACYNLQRSKEGRDFNNDKFKHTNRQNKHHQQTLLGLGERLDSTEERI